MATTRDPTTPAADPRPAPDDAMLAFVAEHMPHAHTYAPWGQDHGQADVWRVQAEDGRVIAFLKRPYTDGHFDRELAAYERWTPYLAGRTPTLLGVMEGDRKTLLLSAASGELAESVRFNDDQWCELHRQAGALAARLHGLPHIDLDPMPLDEAMDRRMSAWLKRAGTCFDAGTIAKISEAFDPGAFKHFARVPCHRDYSPRNWVVRRQDSGLRLSAIDFGHAAADLWLADVLKLWDRAWHGHDDRRAAFFEGYGRAMTEPEALALEMLGIWHGLATAVWSHDHGDPAYEKLGRTILKRLGF